MIALMAERSAPRAPAAPDAVTSRSREVAARGVPSTHGSAHGDSGAASVGDYASGHAGSGDASTERTASELAARAVAGDRAALEALLRAHSRDVAALCHHVAGASDGRDAAQESLERIVRELARFDASRGAFRSWALTVARNVCRDRLRRRGLERQTFDREGEVQTGRAEGRVPDPERLVIAREGASRLALALGGLPEPMQSAIVMFHVGEASYEEIAKTLDVPIGTVMTWLFRGRQRLRAAIEEP